MKFPRKCGSIVVALTISCVAAQQQIPVFGGKFRELMPPQQALVLRWAAEYKAVFQRQLDPEKVYNDLPLSARTTFQAVTHALMNTKLTSADGKSLGTAIDLIDVVERVSGKVPNTRGDRQFRIYVYLKPRAINKLYAAKEFRRTRDNTVYHVGYPVNFRQQGGAPSIQFSVARTGRRADIDVDYRSSSPAKALFDGHLTAANSDVRAGQNDRVHNRRWNGLSNWWTALLATFIEKPIAEESIEGLAARAEAVRKRIERSPAPETIHAFLADWLIKAKPEELLPLVSIKAYPCVNEFGGDSRPDSKLALARILREWKERNTMLGRVARLEDVVQPVAYPLPGGVAVSHAYQGIFSLQEVPDDVAWATDCRVRSKMQLVESIPRPSHRLNRTYVVSMRIRNPKRPDVFLTQTWKQESGDWRIVAFQLRSPNSPPVENLLTAEPALPQDSDAGQVAAEAEKLLTTWLVRKRPDDAAKFFHPESYSCDAFAEDDSAPKPAGVPDQTNVLRFLREAANQALPNEDLAGVIAAGESSHHELKPIPHRQGVAFLLAELSGDLLRMSPCHFDEKDLVKPSSSKPAGGVGLATVFRLVHTQGDETAAITLHWKRLQNEWRVASYSVSID